MSLTDVVTADPIDSSPSVTDSVVTLSQWADLHRVRFLSSEQRLYFAVLEDAIRAITATKGHRFVERKADAMAWVAGEYARIKFEDACDAIGIDPSWLREALENNSAIMIKRRSPVSGYDSAIPFQRLSGTGRTLRGLSKALYRSGGRR